MSDMIRRYPMRIRSGALNSFRLLGRTACLCSVATVLGMTGSLADSADDNSRKDDVNAAKPEVIVKIGVRDDARPFSYRDATREGEPVLAGFGGYTVDICRHVLSQMNELDDYEHLLFMGELTTADDRFLELGRDSGLFMLCGPDSVTMERLHGARVSHPVFESGMTYAYIDPGSSKFPREAYCENIIGVVHGTTADTVGLRDLVAQNLLMRFNKAVELELRNSGRKLMDANDMFRALIADQLEQLRKDNKTETALTIAEILRDSDPNSLHDNIGRFISSDEEDIQNFGRILRDKNATQYKKINEIFAKSLVTTECPEGFKRLPIRKFPDHNQGIEAFCDGSVIYYLGDYDIIRNKVREHGDCDVVLTRFTRSREVYAVFFPERDTYLPPLISIEQVEADFAPAEDKDDDDKEKKKEEKEKNKAAESVWSGAEVLAADAGEGKGVQGSDSPSVSENTGDPIDIAKFYAKFNNLLFIAMQGRESHVERLFEQEFGTEEKSPDLEKFFDSFKISSFDER